MKKASKMAGLLLPLVMAMIMLGGCPNGTTDDPDAGYQNPTASSTTLKTYYIKALDTSRDAPWNDISAFNRIHFHAPKGVGFKIQKVFVSDTIADGVPADAVMKYDFTQGNTAAEYDLAQGSTLNGTVADGLWSFDNSNGISELYPGNIGLALDGKAYIGFVMANFSDTSKFDNLQIEFHSGTPSSAYRDSKAASYYFGFTTSDPGPDPDPDPEIDLTQWTAAYFELTGENGLDTSINRFFFHVNTGNVEIQKVLVNNQKSLTGAVTVLDFTQNADPNSTYPYLLAGYDYDSTLAGLVQNGGTANGKYVLSSTGTYVGGGNFGSGAAYDNSSTHWIFIIRTDGELEDSRFVVTAGGTELTFRFEDLQF